MSFCLVTQLGPYMCLLDQSGVKGGGLNPSSVDALFVNLDNIWMERFGNLRLCCLLVLQIVESVHPD